MNMYSKYFFFSLLCHSFMVAPNLDFMALLPWLLCSLTLSITRKNNIFLVQAMPSSSVGGWGFASFLSLIDNNLSSYSVFEGSSGGKDLLILGVKWFGICRAKHHRRNNLRICGLHCFQFLAMCKMLNPSRCRNLGVWSRRQFLVMWKLRSTQIFSSQIKSCNNFYILKRFRIQCCW